MSVPAEGEFATPLETYTHIGHAALGWLARWMDGVSIARRNDSSCHSQQVRRNLHL
jgi:hypothetical protein